MRISDLNDREFKITVLKKHNELQENTDRQFNKLRNNFNEQNKYFTKETETLKKEPNSNSGDEELDKRDKE